MPRKRASKAWLLCCAVFAASAAHAEPLSFADAVARASMDGPTITAQDAALAAAEHAIRPAGQLPDPQLVLGLQNVPVDGRYAYRLDRDSMTMQSIGIMQEMPSGAERRARRAVAEADAARAGAGLEIVRLQARLGAAAAWIELYFAERRIEVLDRIAAEARALAEAARARLGSGAGSVDDAISAEIEAARIEDRRADLAARVVAARAELRRWVGDVADEALTPDGPTFQIDPQRFRENLRRHPNIEAYRAEDSAAQANLRLADAERAPDWSWSLMYQRRAHYDDMASVELRFSLPLFQGSRQTPMIEARRADASRVVALRAAAEREFGAVLERQLAEYASASASLVRARETRLPLSQRRAAASAGAFSGGTATSDQVVSARLAALEAELDVLDIEERVSTLGAALTLQYGESAP